MRVPGCNWFCRNWEASFVDKIDAVREKELGLLRQSTIYRAGF
eukprot:SAG31_NODE_230_length_19771_cov_90.041739_3_plen_43_part_00